MNPIIRSSLLAFSSLVPVLSADEPKFTGGATAPRGYVAPGFPVSKWTAEYEWRDIREWSNRWHKGIYGSWFNGGREDVAKGYITTWGPLGLRTYMHDRAWTKETAFVDRAPDILKTGSGELFANAFEVLEVLPGSPAEGHLEPGDLIVGMENQSLRSAQEIDLPEPYHHQGTRSLALHAGTLLDEAEGRGEVRFNVLRRPRAVPKVSGKWFTLAEQAFSHHGKRPPHEFRVEIRGPQEVRLSVDDGGNGIGSDGFSWRSVMLEKAGRTTPLSEIKGLVHQVGYGRASYDEATDTWAAHAKSEIRFKLPAGQWTLTAIGQPTGAATVLAHIGSRPVLKMPRPLVDQARLIAFPIPKVGTFQKEPGGACAKTANIIAQQAAWLAVQQQDDGSWQRPHGYTGNHYDTAWAGLGLMATGDPAFDDNIRKAADFLAFKAKPDGWAVPSSSVAIFLGEYWLRYRDDRILPALEVWVNCLLVESLTGDYTAGHGHNPGYRGTGVSTGGSHAAAALAVAGKTPIDLDPTVLDRMLRRVQEIAPDGHVPYGRGRGRVEFTPALKAAATYSGRHGPYLVASAIHGGPRLFTENCTRMYAEGPKGGSDQGHATETLSNQWAFIAMAATDLKAYREHLEAMRWKITLRRCFDGGFCQSAFRLEYAGGESLLDGALRSGSWLVGLCGEKRNLAITGDPKYRAKRLVEQAPVQHVDAMVHGCYLREWAVVDSALGERSPPGLSEAVAELKSIGQTADVRERVEAILRERAGPLAREVAAVSGVSERTRAYLVEMLMGMNVRIETVPVADEPGAFDIVVDQEFPFAGLDLDPAALDVAGASLTGRIRFVSESGVVPVPDEIVFDAATGVNWKAWNSRRSKVRISGPEKEPFELGAVFDFTLAGIPLKYERRILFNQGEEYGNGEKGRKVINDRRVWVPGTLAQDHARWNISFDLPNGVFVAAATQGNEILVQEKGFEWVSPRDQGLPMGASGEFCYTSGWQRWEARVPVFRFTKPLPLIEVVAIAQGSTEAPPELVRGMASSMPLNDQSEVEIELAGESVVRALDLRAEGVGSVVIEARLNRGQWKTIHIGRPGILIKRPVRMAATELRVRLENVKPNASLKLLRLYRQVE